MTKFRPLFLVLALITAVCAGFLAGAFLPPNQDFFTLRKSFTIFGKLYEELALGYVDPVDAADLMRTGIDAMLSTMDPYTVFIDEADSEDIDIMTRGRYGGVGLTLGQRAGRSVVLQTMEGYSAFEQGLRPGDVLLTVDGISTEGMSTNELSSALRGEPGSTVAITIERVGERAPLDFVLTRARIQLDNVGYSGWADHGIGFIRLDRFTRNAAQEVADAIEHFRAEGTLNGLVLDLRGNPGGLLEEAVHLAGLFVPRGTPIVSTRGRSPGTERMYRSENNPIAPELPLAILIDGTSASASEIVAGALQDHDRAVIIGETTFGKGLVQVIRSLPYNTSLKLTVSRYHIPSGRSIQAIDHSHGHVAIHDSLRQAFTTAGGRVVYDGRGIEPDIEVSFGEMSELEESLVRRAAFFLYANDYAARNGSVSADFRVTDAEYQAFKNWLEADGFTFTTRAEYAVGEMAEALSELRYEQAAAQALNLRSTVESERERDFERHAPRIRERLRREILSRSLTGTAQVEAGFLEDIQLAEALRFLNDPASYRGILSSNGNR